MDTINIADPGADLLALGCGPPISEVLICANDPHLLVGVHEGVEHSEADCELLPDVIDLHVLVRLANMDHLVEDLVVKNGDAGEDAEVCDPVDAPLPVEELFVLRVY